MITDNPLRFFSQKNIEKSFLTFVTIVFKYALYIAEHSATASHVCNFHTIYTLHIMPRPIFFFFRPLCGNLINATAVSAVFWFFFFYIEHIHTTCLRPLSLLSPSTETGLLLGFFFFRSVLVTRSDEISCWSILANFARYHVVPKPVHPDRKLLFAVYYH